MNDDRSNGQDRNWESEAVERSIRNLASRIETQVRVRPITTLVAAFGVGYVLGGGLPKIATRFAGLVGFRLMSEKVLRELLMRSGWVAQESDTIDVGPSVFGTGKAARA
jgi:hypothetical protein